MIRSGVPPAGLIRQMSMRSGTDALDEVDERLIRGPDEEVAVQARWVPRRSRRAFDGRPESRTYIGSPGPGVW